jgi:hypothetical protein
MAMDMKNMGKEEPGPMGGKPKVTITAEMATPSPSQADPAERLLDAAEKEGALKPLEEALKGEGADISPRDCMKYAQYDDRTKGKSPEELAKMLSEDPSLIGDIISEMEKRTDSELSEYQNPDEMMRSRMKEAKTAEMPEEY